MKQEKAINRSRLFQPNPRGCKVGRGNELRERIPVSHDTFLNLFQVRAPAAKVIFVCCLRDPRGLLSRERDMFRLQTFEV